MLSNSEFIRTRLEVLETIQEQQSQGIRIPSTEQKAVDPITKLIQMHQKYQSVIDNSRIGIFKTLTVSENEDGTISFKPFDVPAYRSLEKAINDYSKRMLACEDALERLQKIDGIGYYADLRRSVDAGKSKVNHLQQKLEQLQHSTRHDEQDMKQLQKEVKAELSEATTECKKHQATLDKVNSILAEVDIEK